MSDKSAPSRQTDPGRAGFGLGLAVGALAAFIVTRCLPGPFAVFRGMVLRVVRLGFPREGWDIEPAEDREDCIAFNIRRCIYLDSLTSYGAPELTPVYCAGDDKLFGALPPSITWERTMTLGRGHDYCDFRWCRSMPRAT